MAKLEYLHHWARYVPDIGDNRSLEKPFFLEVATGMSAADFRKLFEDLSASRDAVTAREGHTNADLAAAQAEVLARVVRLGSEPLVVGDRPIATLAEYCDLGFAHLGVPYTEMLQAVQKYNSVGEAHQPFFERRSGGSPTTPEQSAAPAGAQTAGP